MSARHTKPPLETALTPNELRDVADTDIDFSDMPEADESFWIEARLVRPGNLELDVKISVHPDVVAYFRPSEAGYATRLAAALEDYVRERRAAEARPE